MTAKNNLLGSIGEKLVEIELLKRNIGCWQLAGNNPYFDLVVEVNGSLKKIQVKTANSNNVGKFNYFLQNSAGFYDYLILVQIKKGSKLGFHIIPSSVICDNTGITIGKSGKYDKYIDNWEFIIE